MTMAEFAKVEDRLTVDDLWIVAHGLASKEWADRDLVVYGLATEALRFFFGNEWTNENVFSMHTQVSPEHRDGRAFLRTDAADDESRFRHQQRVVMLGELAFNLQSIDGFKERLKLMDKLDLESALGEMECTSLVAASEMQFRFVTPAGTKGEDYEGEVTTRNNRVLCCEMKAKSEATSFDGRTLYNTLESARKQLPKGKPGMVFVKIPEEWLKQDAIRSAVESAVEKVFRQSQRLVAVVLLWEEWEHLVGPHLVVAKYRYYVNHRSDLYGVDVDHLLEQMGRVKNLSWVNFHYVASVAACKNQWIVTW